MLEVKVGLDGLVEALDLVVGGWSVYKLLLVSAEVYVEVEVGISVEVVVRAWILACAPAI